MKYKILFFAIFILAFSTQVASSRAAVNNNFISKDNRLTVKTSSQITITKVFPPALENEGKQFVSDFYQIDSAIDSNDYDLSLVYKVDDYSSKSIYLYNQELNTWQSVTGYNDVKEKFISTKLQGQAKSIILAVFADYQTHDGIASYYNQSRYKYFNYKNGNFAASRDYPKGTKLKVTRLKTGQSIIVTVNDYGPELKTNRLIDLDTYAFKQLGSLGAGLIYVKVEPYDQSK